MDVDTGITSEVFTIKSETKLIDIFNNIINKKSEACLNYIDSLNLDKTPSFSGKLTGIKGQYLIFGDGTVFNIRSSEGYVVNLEV